MKKVKINFLGIDNRPENLLDAFRNAAIDQGWKEQEISMVLNDACKGGGYDHFLKVLMENTEPESRDD